MKKLFLLAVLCLLALPAAAADRGVAVKPKPGDGKERRIALVIGNSAYLVSPLRNPANDAKLMAKTLRGLGFNVDERTNLSQGQMKQAIEDFGRSIKQGGVGLFYYAGHGMQVNGRNYLVPVDADIQGEAEVEIKAVDAAAVLAKMEIAQNGMNIVILDACRNNPFARSFRAANPGLASMNAPSGTLIAYATAPGSVASDGTGANGLYTEQLAGNMKKPGLRIEDVFKQVRSGVQSKTQGKQVPWESSSLVGDFYFSGSGGVDRSRLEGLAEGSKERQAELARLQKLEAEAAAQKQKEQAEIDKREKELAALDAQIAAMKGRLGSGSASASDSLEKMVAMVEKKEADARRLEALRKQREEEERKRQAEIEAEIEAGIEADIAKYEAIANSPYGKDMVPTAWKSLTQKYASAEGIENIKVGNTGLLRMLLMEPVKMVFVNGGCFQMGDTFGDGDSDEKPVHEVCVDDFYIGKFEVTQAQWRTIAGDNPSVFSSCGDTCPVDSVSWGDIQDFIRLLNQRTGKNYRLPTETEWEYAARSGGRSEKYSGGNDLNSVGWYDGNSGRKTHPVGQKQPNGLGIHDMSGNVWEWCSDWYDGYYKNSLRRNPQGPSTGSDRVLRGGGFLDSAGGNRATIRGRDYPRAKRAYGLRLARSK